MTKSLLLLVIVTNMLLPHKTFSQVGVWTEQSSGVTVTLTSANAYLGGTVWVCGYSGTVLRSSNYGVNWQNVSGNGIPSNMQLINIAAVNSSTAVTSGYVGSNTFVYKTTNSGANWTQVFTETGGFINAVVFPFTGSNGFMMGDPVGNRWSLWRTTNSGTTWDSTGCFLPRAGTTEAGWVNSLYNVDQELWFGTNNFKVYHSTNFGSTWEAQSTGTEANSYAVWFEKLGTDRTGYAGGTTLVKTTNYGANWSSITSAGSGNFGGIQGGPYIITDNSVVSNIFYVRSNNMIYRSTNNGANFTSQYTAPAGNYRHIGTNYWGQFFWAVRDNGGISFLDLGTAIVPVSSAVPDGYKLSQNYPNPFNPVTKINFSMPYDGHVKITVLDAVGKEISTLVNEQLAAGSYETGFDGGNYSSGIYYYNMTSGNFTKTMKMILLK